MNKFIFTVLVLFASSASAFAYTDTDVYPFGGAINYLTDQGVVQGYSDGTFRPENTINRAEFLKTVVGAVTTEELTGSFCFSDVNDEWFAPYVCTAKDMGIVDGYPDGTFLPANPVNLVEALKIVVNAFEIPAITPLGTEWYSVFLETAVSLNFIPTPLDYYAEPTARGEVAEILWRVMEDVHTQSSTTLEEFKGSSCTEFHSETYVDIDLQRVRDTWLSWTNEARASAGLAAYTYTEQLDRTAFIWSDFSRDRGYMDHKRIGQTAYYDYTMIENWFEDLGVTFVNNSGVTFTENIGHGPYSCSDTECTDELIAAIKYTWDYFIGEVNSSYRPHYNSIMNAYFKEIGFGILVTDSEYYFTVHYGTELASTPPPFCD